MKTIEELVDLLESGNHEEAYQGFAEIYARTHDLQVLFYMTFIKMQYHAEETPVSEIEKNLNQILSCGNPEMEMMAYTNLMLITFNNNDYKRCAELGNAALKKRMRNFQILSYLAQSLYDFGPKKNDRAEELALASLEEEDVSEPMRESVYTFLNEMYNRTFQKEKADALLSRISLSVQDYGYLEFLLGQQEIITKGKKTDLSIPEKTFGTNHQAGMIFYALNGLAGIRAFDKMEQFARDALAVATEEEKMIIYTKMVETYQKVNCLEDAIVFLEKEAEGYSGQDALLGMVYYARGYVKDYEKAIVFLQHAYEKDPKDIYLKYIANSYLESGRAEKCVKLIPELIARHPEDRELYAYEIDLAIKTQDYDKAERLCLALPTHGVSLEEWWDIYYQCASDLKKTYPYIRKDIRNNVYEKLRMYYYGAYGKRTHPLKTSLLLKKLKKEELWNRSLCLLGHILEKKHPEEAFRYYQDGKKRYDEKKDYSTSCIAFYVHSLAYGIGTEKDMEGAYSLAKKTLKENNDYVSESLGNIYAELSILLNKDLEPVYDFLVKTRVRRYPISRLYMILRVGRILKKDVTEYEKLFSLAYMYATRRERHYYSRHPERVMMHDF